MKKILLAILVLNFQFTPWILSLSKDNSACAQDCEIQLATAIDDPQGVVPEASREQLNSVLTRLATENGATSDITFAEFLITAKIDVLDKHIVQGAPVQYVNNLGVTFNITDIYTSQKYANTYIEVDGVGQSEIKSFNNAIRNLRPQNAKIQTFMKTAKDKILAFYDKNYQRILTEAQRYAALKQYDKALAMTCAIPTCSKGGKAAVTASLKIYNQYRDRYAQLLLDQAKKVWAANPTLAGAQQAVALLEQIDPEASNRKEVTAFLATMHKQVQIDVDFETKTKYKDAVELEKFRIDAVKEIGKAYGYAQQKVIVTGGIGTPAVIGGTTK